MGNEDTLDPHHTTMDYWMDEGLGGLGVDETALVSALGRWRREPEKRAQFRRGFPGFFSSSAGAGIERCEDEYLLHLKAEFARFKDAAVLWAMHPWERDARWAHHVLHKAHPPHILVEVACTRAADDLLGARRAYQALYHRSLEEDVAYRVRDANASVRAASLLLRLSSFWFWAVTVRAGTWPC